MKLGWKRILTICAALGLAGLLIAMVGKALGGRTALAFRTDDGMMIYRPWGSAFYGLDGDSQHGVVDNMLRLARWGEDLEDWSDDIADDLDDWLGQGMEDFLDDIEDGFEDWAESTDWDALEVDINQWFEEGEVTMGPVINEKLEEIRDLDVATISAPVRIKEGQGFAISIVQNNDRLEVGYQMKDGRLTVKERKIPGLHLNLNNLKSNEIEITIPAGVALGDAQLRSVSGSIDLDLENAAAEAVKMDTVSGRMKADGFAASQAELQSVSGRIELEADVSQRTVLHSVSGNIQAEGRLTGEIQVDTVSGGVDLEIKDQPNLYQYNCSSTSGRIQINGQSYKRSVSKADGSNRIDVVTISGRIQLEFDKD